MGEGEEGGEEEALKEQSRSAKMLSQLSREPLVVFIVLFVLSLLASYVLFKLLDSRASIKRKGWSAGGAIAGFLMILFGSWYAIRPSLMTRPRTMPVSVPAGFKPLDVSDIGIALAVPKDWERKPHPTEIFLVPRQQQQNSPTAMFIVIAVQSCDGPQFIISESDLQKVQQPLAQMMGMIHLRGPSISEAYLGCKASVTPASIVFPGEVLLPPMTTNLVINIVLKEI